MSRYRICVWCVLVLVLLFGHDYRPDAIALAIAPYQFNLVSWELGNLPDKWMRRVINTPRTLIAGSDQDSQRRQVHRYFEIGQRLREIDRRVVVLYNTSPRHPASAVEIEDLRREGDRLREDQNDLRPRVEESLESAVANTLHELGFGTRAGVFPPLDTVLTGSPTVLILSPRDRIERHDGGLLRTGLNHFERADVENPLETESGWSALVENTGGIALYPSITAGNVSLQQAMDIIAHEWVHQWLWFRPLGRRYFESGELTAINETVASIAGAEIGMRALQQFERPPPVTPPAADPGATVDRADPPRFDFQAEMRATRERTDELLGAGDITGAEEYMEQRRRLFVEQGYPIRKLNQAYFAFHGSYGTTGAAGISIIGEQVQELRRRSPSLADFLRTAAQITSADDLAGYLNGTAR